MFAKTIRQYGDGRWRSLFDLALLSIAAVVLGTIHHSLRPLVPLGGTWMDPAYRALPVVEMDTVRQLLGSAEVVLVDARSKAKYRSGHITGAISIPVDSRISVGLLARLQRASTVIVYCASSNCLAADDEALALIKAGVEEVYVFRGGISQWSRAGYQLVAGDS